MYEWHFYLIRTRYGTLYAGITTDVRRRFSEHETSEKGAKYLRSKGPLQLVYQVKIGNHALALRTEREVKKLTKQEKEKIVKKQPGSKALLNDLKLRIEETPDK